MEVIPLDPHGEATQPARPYSSGSIQSSHSGRFSCNSNHTNQVLSSKLINTLRIDEDFYEDRQEGVHNDIDGIGDTDEDDTTDNDDGISLLRSDTILENHSTIHSTQIQLGSADTDLGYLAINISYSTLIDLATVIINSADLLNTWSARSELVQPPSEVYTNSSQLTSQVVPYENLSPTSKLAFGRQSIIEEIIETEESYISSLKMLSGIYFDSLINKGNNGIPVQSTNAYVKILIETHEEFLSELRYLSSLCKLPLEINQIENINNNNEVLSCSSPLMSLLVAELIAKKAIPVYVYQEYSSIHDLVLKLMESKEDDPEMGNTLTRSYQKFLESTQKKSERMDLSFRSLVSKPVSRIAKYKLFLDALAKLTPVDKYEACHKKIMDCMVKVDYSIMEVNRYGLQEKIRAQLLFTGLVFNSSSTKLKFPVEYLGLPLLSGALYTSWVELKECEVTCQPFGAFLFKSHLILSHVIKSNRFDVKFLVPLSVCKVVDCDDIEGGMSCNYDKSFKLIFESNFQLFELLLTACDYNEYTIWRERLELLTNVVNGPYKFDYSSSKFNEEQHTSSSTIMPSAIQSFDAKLDKVSNVSMRRHIHYYNPFYESCYFKNIIPVKIQVLDDNGGSFSSVRFRLHVLEVEKGTRLIYLKRLERAKVENFLEDLWSDELTSSDLLDRRKSRKLKRNKSRVTSTTSEIQGPSIDQEDCETTAAPTSTRKRDSLMRKTSIVFGLKSLFGSIVSSTSNTTI